MLRKLRDLIGQKNHVIAVQPPLGEMHQSQAHYFDRALMHQSAFISQRYLGKRTMVFMTCRWGKSAKKTRD